VDCISLEPVDIQLSGWASWPQSLADLARQRYDARSTRLQREALEHDERLAAKAVQKLADLPAHTKGTDHAPEVDRKRAIIEAALAKAKARQTTKA
jgi:electron transport complex protein RnfB